MFDENKSGHYCCDLADRHSDDLYQIWPTDLDPSTYLYADIYTEMCASHLASGIDDSSKHYQLERIK